MNNDGTYSVFSSDSEWNIEKDFQWLWDSDESKAREKKKGGKRKKHKKKMKKRMKKMEKALEYLLMEQERGRKKFKHKSKKKRKKQFRKQFRYRLLEKSAETTLSMVSDLTRMYAQSKLLSSKNSK